MIDIVKKITILCFCFRMILYDIRLQNELYFHRPYIIILYPMFSELQNPYVFRMNTSILLTT